MKRAPSPLPFFTKLIVFGPETILEMLHALKSNLSRDKVLPKAILNRFRNQVYLLVPSPFVSDKAHSYPSIKKGKGTKPTATGGNKCQSPSTSNKSPNERKTHKSSTYGWLLCMKQPCPSRSIGGCF